jgi:branched-chain amino acid transport system ATP-binding protein
MLEVQSVNTFYGRIQALKQVSLCVRQGEIVSLIGANGAGKTTLLNTISGVTPPRSGRIVFDGHVINGMSPERIVGLGISQVPERRQVFSTLSVLDNLILGAYLRFRHDSRASIERDLELVFGLFPILKERSKQPGGTLSGGEQQMLVVGRGLMAQPKLLLLDEPSLGLAPLVVQEILRVVGQLREHGTTILLVEQNARAALRVADRAYVLETGHVVMEGTATELAANEDVQKAYLGKRQQRNRVPRVPSIPLRNGGN